MYSLVLLYIHGYTCIYSSTSEYIAVYRDSLRKLYTWMKPDKKIYVCMKGDGFVQELVDSRHPNNQNLVQ